MIHEGNRFTHVNSLYDTPGSTHYDRDGPHTDHIQIQFLEYGLMDFCEHRLSS